MPDPLGIALLTRDRNRKGAVTGASRPSESASCSVVRSTVRLEIHTRIVDGLGNHAIVVRPDPIMKRVVRCHDLPSNL